MSQPKLKPAMPVAFPGPEPKCTVQRWVRKPEGWQLLVYRVPVGLFDGEAPIRSYGPDPMRLVIESGVMREAVIASEER